MVLPRLWITLALLITTSTACTSATNRGSKDNKDGQSLFGSDVQDNSKNCYVSTKDDRLKNFYANPPTQTPEAAPQAKSANSFVVAKDGVAMANVTDWVAKDKAKRGADSKYFRYAYIPFSMLKDQTSANAARVALFKALNSTAVYESGNYVGDDVSDGQGAVYAIDVRKLWGQANPDDGVAVYNCVANPLDKDGNVALRTGIISIERMSLANFPADQPVNAARLVYNLLFPNVYDVLIDTPQFQSDLLRDLGIDQIDYDKILAWVGIKDSIVFGPRVAKMVRTVDGRNYWASQDYFDGAEHTEMPYAHDVSPVPVLEGDDGWVTLPGRNNDGSYSYDQGAAEASEAWVEMRNGFLAYYIWGNAHQERGRAEQSFVIDPDNQVNGYLLTGRSCITCHKSGPQAAPNQMRQLVDAGTVTQDVEKAKEIWTPQTTLDQYYDETKSHFSAAMTQIVNQVSDDDPAQNASWIHGQGDEPIKFLVTYVEAGNLDGPTGSGPSSGQ